MPKNVEEYFALSKILWVGTQLYSNQVHCFQRRADRPSNKLARYRREHQYQQGHSPVGVAHRQRYAH